MKPGLDVKYWNDLYLTNGSAWDVGYVSTPLKEYFDQLKNKDLSILIPGAGNAYEAEYLVNNGFKNVFVCDFAAEPLSNLQKRCPAIKKENLLKVDFFEINRPVGSGKVQVSSSVVENRTTINSAEKLTFDLIIEQTFFCALDPALRQKYFEKMHELLKPGGKLVGVLFNCQFDTGTAPFGGTMEEYRQYFEKFFKINVYEACRNSIKPRAGRELFINLEKAINSGEKEIESLHKEK